MIFEYYCEACDDIISIEMSMKDTIPSKVTCPACNKEASRVWNNTSIKIPDHMKAMSEDAGSYTEYDNLKSKFKNAKRPSGKEKIYY